MRKQIIAIAFIFLVMGVGKAQELSEYAQTLKPNVVKLSAKFDAYHTELGFGFITGENLSGDSLFIVTARHVVIREEEQDVFFPLSGYHINVEFFFINNRVFKGRVFDFSLTSRDLALVIVEKPRSFDLSKEVINRSYSKGMSVSFIGREGEWYIPEDQAEGSINDFRERNIIVDIASVRPGTSGAPLISQNGIIGMIISDSDASQVYAIDINEIEVFVTENGRRANAFILYPILKKAPHFWLGIGSVLIGGGLLTIGIRDEIDAQSNYDIYTTVRRENDPIYNSSSSNYIGFDREGLYSDANTQHKRGITMISAGSVILAAGGAFIVHKINVKRKNEEKGYQHSVSIFPHIVPIDLSSGNLGLGIVLKF